MRTKKFNWRRAAINFFFAFAIVYFTLHVALWIFDFTDRAEPVSLPREPQPQEERQQGERQQEERQQTADLELLASLIQAEAGGEPFNGQVAVGAVVLNRVNDPRWPNTIEEVIFQPGQFCTSDNLPEPSQEALRAAREAWEGVDPSNRAAFFYNPNVSRCSWIVTREEVAEIGGHRFAR